MSSINDLQMMISTNPLYNKEIDRYKNSDLPTVDFADYLVEKGIFSSKEDVVKYFRDTSIFYDDEKNAKNSTNNQTVEIGGKKYNSGDIAIAVFEFPKYEYYNGSGYTGGDPENDYYVDIGMRYKSSCFDFTYQDDYYTTKLDFTGMTNQEKYLEIYEFFQHCYGENFLDAGAIGYVRPMQGDPYMGILDKFRSYVTNVCGLSKEYPENSNQRRQLRKEALYGDMSDEEIRAEIRAKYPPAGEMTFRDLYKMTNEMDECGIGGFAESCIKWVFRDRNNLCEIPVRETMLDTPVTSKHMQTILNSYEAKVYQNLHVDKNLGTVLKELAAEFGAAGGISVDSVPQSNDAKNDFVWIKI